MVKNPPANAGEAGLIAGLGRSPGEGNGSQLQYSCLENPMDHGAWLGYHPWGRKELDTTERLHFHFLFTNAGDITNVGLIPGLGRSLGGGHGNPLKYSCLENLMDRGAWWAIKSIGLHRVGHD